MGLHDKTVLEPLAAEAIRLGAETLEVEYKGGCEEVFAMKGGFGFGIARLRSSSPEAESLRQELYALTKRSRRITVGEHCYSLRSRVYESFGENAFCVEVRRV
jgi:hypothetical protein